METYLKNYGRNTFIISILLAIFGVCLMGAPYFSITTLILSLGAIVLITGLIHIISYFTSSIETKMFNFELLQGIGGIAIGIIIVLNPQWIAMFLPFIIGIWVLGSSLIRFQMSLSMKEIKESNWELMLILSTFTIFLGIAILVNPFLTSYNNMILCGLLLLFSEVLNIIEYSCILDRLDKKTEKIKKTKNTKKKIEKTEK